MGVRVGGTPGGGGVVCVVFEKKWVGGWAQRKVPTPLGGQYVNLWSGFLGMDNLSGESFRGKSVWYPTIVTQTRYGIWFHASK